MAECHDAPPARGATGYAQQLRRAAALLLTRLPRLPTVGTDGRAGAVNAEPFEVVSFLNRMQKLARIPLLIGGDFERGASIPVAGTIKYPDAMAFAATDSPKYSRELGRATAREARALGVPSLYTPNADVNNDPENPISNIRS